MSAVHSLFGQVCLVRGVVWEGPVVLFPPLAFPSLDRMSPNCSNVYVCVVRELRVESRGHLRIEVDTAVRELAEGSLLLDLGSLLGVLEGAKVR